MRHVQFFISEYIFCNLQVTFLTYQQAIRITALFTQDLQTPYKPFQDFLRLCPYS